MITNIMLCGLYTLACIAALSIYHIATQKLSIARRYPSVCAYTLGLVLYIAFRTATKTKLSVGLLLAMLLLTFACVFAYDELQARLTMRKDKG